MSCGSSKKKLVAHHTADDCADRSTVQGPNKPRIIAVAAVTLKRCTEKHSTEETRNPTDNPPEYFPPGRTLATVV
jgi:hypothetical protein